MHLADPIPSWIAGSLHRPSEPMPDWDQPMTEREARLRRRRGSGDLVMARPPTVGAGLNELDNLIDNLQAVQEKPTPQQQVRDAMRLG